MGIIGDVIGPQIWNWLMAGITTTSLIGAIIGLWLFRKRSQAVTILAAVIFSIIVSRIFG